LKAQTTAGKWVFPSKVKKAPNLSMILPSQLPLTKLLAAMWQWQALVYHR